MLMLNFQLDLINLYFLFQKSGSILLADELLQFDFFPSPLLLLMIFLFVLLLVITFLVDF